MIRKAMALALSILAIGFTLVWLVPTGTSKGQTLITPTATVPSLPSCTHEDGSGQALCVWDADTQGNGMGTDAVSGECAIGTDAENALCVKLWERNARTYDANGSMVGVADGRVLVSECTSGMADLPMMECIKAELEM